MSTQMKNFFQKIIFVCILVCFKIISDANLHNPRHIYAALKLNVLTENIYDIHNKFKVMFPFNGTLLHLTIKIHSNIYSTHADI